MTARLPIDHPGLPEQYAAEGVDSGIQEEIIESWNNTGWGLCLVAAVLALFLGWNAVQLHDENVDLRERLVAAQMELDSKRAYDDSWTCTYDRRDPRSAKGIIRHCIRTVEAF